MKRVVLEIFDDEKAESILSLLRDLTYVETRVEDSEKIWKGNLPVFESPVNISGFRMYTREELYER